MSERKIKTVETKNNNKKPTNILIIIAISLLLLVLFKDTIKANFKTKEVLKRANVFNILDVADDCFDELSKKANSGVASQKCLDSVEKYRIQTHDWDVLIKQNRDLNCDDFSSKTEAWKFQQYISGELANYLEEYKDSDGSIRLGFRGGIWNLKCSYDPYRLDTDGNCIACENF